MASSRAAFSRSTRRLNSSKPVKLDSVKKRWNWKPIRHCPGRFILPEEQFNGPPQELLGPGIELREFRVDTAKDPVVIARLDEGGLISYKHSDGAYVHTLNTSEGFERKLLQLGIKPEEI